jgi:ribosomal protein S18 acetylase RimI-like enzyme
VTVGEPHLRPGLEADADAVAALLYTTAAGMYDASVGGRAAALRILRAAYGRPANSASREVVTIADAGGEVAGAIAAFPVHEGESRSRRFLRVTLARSAPWRWAGILRMFRVGAQATPPAPPDALYVDALATAETHRRGGVATALLDEAARAARRQGLGAVALDAAASNGAARALYEGAGFQVTQRRAAIDGLPGIVGYVRRL